MINWELLYNKFGKKKCAEKFEDMALDYVRDVYSEYTWKPTGRTRDGNRDFHNLEDDLLAIWGEAKYKKDSISLTRKDLDPTILSGLIEGTVTLIIFVTNGKVPESLITRMTLGANMRGIKISFVMGKQLSDWLILNPEKYKWYFQEELQKTEYKNDQLVEFKKISFYEPISLDFKPNFDKVSMNVDDIFILNCLIFNSQAGIFKIELEDDAPLSLIESEKYENPNCFELKPGINVISFLVRAKHQYKNVIRIALICNDNVYHCISKKLVIEKSHQLNIYYFQQLDVLGKIKLVIDGLDASIGNYAFFIHGCSGMGKSYILKSLSLDYCLNNDLTLVTFENGQNSNANYLLLCRVIIFLQYGNIFWDYNKANIKKFCITFNSLNGGIDISLLNEILNGCFDANIAKTVIEYLNNLSQAIPVLVSPKQQKNFRILLLDDIQNLNRTQGLFLSTLVEQQLNSKNNTILVLAGQKNEFDCPFLENKLYNTISNYYELNKLGEKDIEGTILQNFNIKEKLLTSIINELPSNLLLLSEILSNLKYSFRHNGEINNSQFINDYIKLYNNKLVFQEKFIKLKDEYYLLDIMYLFEKGIPASVLYAYPAFDKNVLKKDIKILINYNCISQIGQNMLLPFHNYIVESYKKLRKGKEYNERTGDFLCFLLNKKPKEVDINHLLSIICKCGRKYFRAYKESIQDLMIQYIRKSEYGTAVIFADLFYKNISNKNCLTKNEKYYLYLYADCLVHCDNMYRAKQLLQQIADGEDFFSFEKYEASISLLNQRFWSMELNGIVEDSKIYQMDLENIFMDNLNFQMLGRFKKAYESCFNRRMVTLLLLGEYHDAQKAYQEGVVALKVLSTRYGLNFHAEIATIIMDYARGNMAEKPKMSYRLFFCAIKFFSECKSEYIRRTLICHIDLMVNENILKQNVNYKKFMHKVEELNKLNFLPEYIKGMLKLYACRMIDYSRINNHGIISGSFITDFANQIEQIKARKRIVLKNRELYLYNYLMAYFYIVQNEYTDAEVCLKSNMDYIKGAGNTYKIPLEHNLKNFETIQGIEWFQEGKTYSDKIYLLDSRFW
ncbi:MAG: hypothetical protein K2N51_03200 [Lachnospiraceae bacterium]|nr:hypothetical protein [Lachnospiraceae bacterium]